MHLTLRQLHYFLKIVDAGNMTRAADSLHLAPTALSLQVRAMEERLGVGLLQRHSRGVRPTRAGAELYKRGQQILSMVDETERLVAPGELADIRCLRLGVLPSALRMIGVNAVLAGSNRLGGLVVQLVEGFSGDLAIRLQHGELDFVLACEIQSSPSMRMLELIEEGLVFVTCPTDAREGGKITLADALASDLIFYGENDMCWKIVHAAARSARLPINVAHKVGSIDVIRHMVSRGLGTGIMPFGIIEEESRRGEIAVHVIEGHPLVRRISLAWLAAGENKDDAKELLNFVVDVVTDLHARTIPYSRLLVKNIGTQAASSNIM